MIERVSRWYCAHFHKGVIWKGRGYECPVCFRLYQVPWQGDYYRRRPKPEISGIDRFFAQADARYLERLEAEMATSLDPGRAKPEVRSVPDLAHNPSQLAR